MRKLLLYALVIVSICVMGVIATKVITDNRTTIDLNDYSFISVEVKAGDTIWDIGSKNLVDGDKTSDWVKAVKKVNNMYSDRIYSGGHVIILVPEK